MSGLASAHYAAAQNIKSREKRRGPMTFIIHGLPFRHIPNYRQYRLCPLRRLYLRFLARVGNAVSARITALSGGFNRAPPHLSVSFQNQGRHSSGTCRQDEASDRIPVKWCLPPFCWSLPALPASEYSNVFRPLVFPFITGKYRSRPDRVFMFNFPGWQKFLH
jgi:hypothetical protein